MARAKRTIDKEEVDEIIYLKLKAHQASSA